MSGEVVVQSRMYVPSVTATHYPLFAPFVLNPVSERGWATLVLLFATHVNLAHRILAYAGFFRGRVFRSGRTRSKEAVDA